MEHIYRKFDRKNVIYREAPEASHDLSIASAEDLYNEAKKKIRSETQAELDEFKTDSVLRIEQIRDANPRSKEDGALTGAAIELKLLGTGVSPNSLFTESNLTNNHIARDGKNWKVSFVRESVTVTQNCPTLEKAIQALLSSTNEKTVKVAEAMQLGIAVYESQNTIAESYEKGAKFEENKELLCKLQNQIPNMWILSTDLELKLPQELEVKGDIYFSYINGTYKARTMKLVENDDFYEFEPSKGWIQSGAEELILQTKNIYEKQANGSYKIDEENIREVAQLGLAPQAYITHILNTAKREGNLNDGLLDAVLLEHPFPIPFPAIDGMEIKFDKDNKSASKSQMEAHLYKAYTQLLGGINSEACKTFSTYMASKVVDTILDKGTDTDKNKIVPEEKYKITCEELENADSILNPSRFKIEKIMDKEAIAKIEELESWKEKIKTSILGKIPLIGAGAAFIPVIGGLMDSALSTVWGDVRTMGADWAKMEKTQGKKLNLLGYIGAAAAASLNKIIRKEPLEENSFFGKLFKRFSGSEESQPATTQDASVTPTQNPETPSAPEPVAEVSAAELSTDDIKTENPDEKDEQTIEITDNDKKIPEKHVLEFKEITKAKNAYFKLVEKNGRTIEIGKDGNLNKKQIMDALKKYSRYDNKSKNYSLKTGDTFSGEFEMKDAHLLEDNKA